MRRQPPAPLCVLLLVFAGAVAGCATEELGILPVVYRFEAPDGRPLSCSLVGAETVEVAFFDRAGDSVAFDVVEVPCLATDPAGSDVAVEVQSTRFAVVRVSFLDALGRLVQLCDSGGQTVAAVYDFSEVDIPPSRAEPLRVTVLGDPGPCP